MSRRLMLLAPPILALTLALGVVLAAALYSLGAPIAPRGAAAQAAGTPGARTIAVRGEGRVAVTPDLAYVTFGVETSGANLVQAQRENTALMTAVLDTLKASGIEEKDLQTVGYNVSPQIDREGRQTGWRVGNVVRATVRDLSSLGGTIDQVVAAGATRVSGVSFDVANKDDAIRRAREAAVADARGKAEHYARLTNVQLGAPVTIVEDSSPARAPQPAGAPAQRGGDGSTPIEAGEGTITVTVQISFEIR